MKIIKIMAVVLFIIALTGCQKDEDTVSNSVEAGKVEKPWNMITYKGMIERLEHYDKTKKPVLEKVLGFEDTRINYYSIETIENYIKYIKQLSKEKGIEFTGINFVSGAYPESTTDGVAGYQNIMFMPTTNINGNNIGFDPLQSTNDNLVTIKEVLASYGYNWVYDSKEDYDKRNVISKKIQSNLAKRQQLSDLESGGANLGTFCPPHDPKE